MVCRAKPLGKVVEIRMVAPNGKIVATGHVSPPTQEAYEVWSAKVTADLHLQIPSKEEWYQRFGCGLWTTETAQ